MSLSAEAVQLRLVQSELSDLQNRYDDLKIKYDSLEKEFDKLKKEKSHRSDNDISNIIHNNNKRLEKLLKLAKMSNNSNLNRCVPKLTYNFSCTTSQIDLIIEENESDSQDSDMNYPMYLFTGKKMLNDENITPASSVPILSPKSSTNTILSTDSSKSSVKFHKKNASFTGLWMKDEESERCSKCNKKFSFNNRRHHCRICGLIFCGKCCSKYRNIPGLGFKQKICEDCHNIPENVLQENYNSFYLM